MALAGPDQDVADFKAAFDEGTKDDVKAPAAEPEGDVKMIEERMAVEPAMSFKEAFAAARKSPEAMAKGKFDWNGKQYSTALAGDPKPVAKPVAKPAVKADPIITETKPTATDEIRARAVSETAKQDAASAAVKAVASQKRPGIMAGMRRKDAALNDKIIAGAVAESKKPSTSIMDDIVSGADRAEADKLRSSGGKR